MRWLDRHGVGLLVRLGCVAALSGGLVVLGAPPVLAAPGQISTVAGGVGQGAAVGVAQVPLSVAAAVYGSSVYVGDNYYHVVRRLDTGSGLEVAVAGDGATGFSGDGGPATAAELGVAPSVAVDAAGDIFIADTANNRIRAVPAASGTLLGQSVTGGDIYTVAGNGTQGFAGDGGPATAAKLSDPLDMAVDASGNLFIADAFNNVVRVVAAKSGTLFGQNVTAGDIYTVAGDGTRGLAGDGGPAAAAELYGPFGVALDAAGNLYISDSGNKRVRVVAAQTGTLLGQSVTAGDIYTVAGDGTAGFLGDGGPATAAELSDSVTGVAVDSAGDLYIADQHNNRVRVVAAQTGTLLGQIVTAGDIYTVVGDGTAGFAGDGGPATAAEVRFPSGVALDAAGNLFIADQGNFRLRVVAARTGTVLAGQSLAAGDIYTVAGNGTLGYGGDGGPATAAELGLPQDVAVDASGNLYILDPPSQSVRAVAAKSGVLFGQSVTAGDISTVTGNGTAGYAGDGGPAAAAELHAPEGLALDASGNLYVADAFNGRIRVVAATNEVLFGVPMVAGDIYTVAGNGAYGYSGDGGPATAAELAGPTGVAVDAAGNLYIADSGNYVVRVVASKSGTLLDQSVTGGDIYTVAGNGTAGYAGDGGPATAAELYYPAGVALDAAGNLYIADNTNARVRVVAAKSGTLFGQGVTAGDIYTVAGNGTVGYGGDGGAATAAELSEPADVALDAAGNLYIDDGVNQRVRVVAAKNGTLFGQSVTAGDIYTVAGNGTAGYAGDGGPATAAELHYPAGVALDAAGNLYIADTDNHRVREVTAPATAAPQLATVSPTSGPVGTTLTLTGSGFGTVAGSVYFTPSSGSPAIATPVAGTWTDGAAQVVVPSTLAAGTVSVAVYSGASGLVSNALGFTVTATGPSGAGQGTLAVAVSAPVGTSLAGDHLLAWSPGLGGGAATTLTGPGSYTLSDLAPAADYDVRIVAPYGRILADSKPVTIAADQTTSLTLTPTLPASLSLTVVDPSGQGVPGVVVVLADAQSGGFLGTLLSGAGGTVATPTGLLLAGGESMQAGADVGQLPYATGTRQTVALAPGSNDLTLQLQPLPTGTIAGRATDVTTGQAVSGVVVMATVTVPDGRQFNATAATATDGGYSLTLPAGQATVQAAARDGIHRLPQPLAVTVPAAGTATADLALAGNGPDSVSIQLFTQYVGGTLQGPLPVDWRVAAHYELQVIDETTRAGSPGWTYPVPIEGAPGDTVQVCLDGAEAQLPSACQDVQLDSQRNAVATFKLIQPGLIAGQVVDGATGQPVSGWTGVLYSLGAQGQKTAIQNIGAASDQLSVAVPVPGSYEVDVATADGRSGSVQVTVAQAQSVDVGSVIVAAPGQFAGQAGNDVGAEPGAAAPGQTVTVRAEFRNGGSATAGEAVALLEVPAGTSLVAGTVLVNGQPASPTASGGGYAVQVGDLAPGTSGTVRYTLQLASDLQAQRLAPSVRLQYQAAGSTRTEVLGAAAIAVTAVSLDVPAELATATTTASGRAPPGTPVTVFDGSAPLGTATAGAGGFWSLPISLPVGQSPGYHVLRAVGALPGGAVSSQAVAVHYDPNTPQLQQVCLQQTDGRQVCLDPSQGVARFPYVFVPGMPFDFSLQFDYPDGVYGVQVGLDGPGGGTAAATLGADGLFHATLTTAPDISGGLYVDYRTRATQAGLAAPPPASQSQVADAAPPWLDGFQIASVTPGSESGGFTVTVPQADGTQVQVQMQFTPNVPYTPSAQDQQQVAQSGWPVYGASMSRTDSGDSSTLTLTGLVPESDLPAAAVARLAAAGVAGGSAACCADPNMLQISLVAYILNNSPTVYNIVNLGSTGLSVGGTALDNWDGESNLARLNDLYQLLNSDGARYLSAQDFDSFRQQFDQLRTLLEGQAALDGLTTIASYMAGGNVFSNVAWGQGLGYVQGKVDNINTQTLTNERDALLNDIQAGIRQHLVNIVSPPGRKVAQLTPIVDPSGYTYEAVPSSRLPGVTATILQQDPTTGAFAPWDAQDYGQQNPQVTDPQGRFGWDVPAGDYQVAFQKDGYGPASSSVVTVPPPQTGIDVGLTSQSPPAVQSVTVSPDGRFLDLNFSQYVLASTLTPATVSVAVYGGAAVSGTVAPQNTVTDAQGDALTLDARFTPASPLQPGQSYAVTTSELVQNYAGVPMAAGDVRTVTVPTASPQPEVTAVAPAVGPAAGGTSVAIQGSGFTGATAVHFGPSPASGVTVASDDEITAVAPAGSGTVDVTVTGPGGTSPASAADRYTYAPLSAPAASQVQQVTPATGPAAGGTSVTLTGSGFTGATAVSFGPNPATSFTVTSDGQITAMTPPETGTVTVTVSTAAGTGGGAPFRYLSATAVPVPPGGGPVSTPDGTATLLLPAGAAGAGQTVSLSELTSGQLETPVPSGDQMVGQPVRLDVGAGLAGAGTLTLTYDPTQVPTGYSAAIWEDGAWTELPTTLAGGQASAT